MEVRDIVKNYIKDNGFDGLFNGRECACSIDDLFPCGGEYINKCEPGYKSVCTCGLGCDFDIGAKPGRT